MTVLVVSNLAKRYRRGGEPFAAVDDVSFEIGPAKTLASRAPPAAASRPSRDWCYGCSSPTPGASNSKERTSSRSQAPRCVRAAPVSRWCSRIRWRVLDDPLRIHGIVSRTQRPRRVAALLERVGLDPGLAARHPRYFRRPAPARRDRPRHRHATIPDRARRSRLGARCFGARTDSGTAARPATPATDRLSLHFT
jgi:ABC-type antimicrobial peptide transport system ATPase subunit